MFIQNTCYKKGINVDRLVLNDGKQLEKILLLPILKDPVTFSFVQQVDTEDSAKYFIFGAKFLDYAITPFYSASLEDIVGLNFFVYEKTYLLFGSTPLCELYSSIVSGILERKKCDFLKLTEFMANLLSIEQEKLISLHIKHAELADSVRLTHLY